MTQGTTLVRSRRSRRAWHSSASSETRRGDPCARRHRPGARRDGRDGPRRKYLPRPPRAVGRRSPHGALRVPLPRRLRADPRRPGVGQRSATARACRPLSPSATSSRRASRCRAWRCRRREPAIRGARSSSPRRSRRSGVARPLLLGQLLGRPPRALSRPRTRAAGRGGRRGVGGGPRARLRRRDIVASGPGRAPP